MKFWDKLSSLVAHWLSALGQPLFKARWGRKHFLCPFWVVIPWLLFTLELMNWTINKLLLPHNLYSSAKNIHLSSQRPFLLIGLSVPFSLLPDWNTFSWGFKGFLVWVKQLMTKGNPTCEWITLWVYFFSWICYHAIMIQDKHNIINIYSYW